MNKSQSKHYTDTLAALLLFAVFAFCAVFALMSGARVYKRISDRDSASRNLRTAEMYLFSKVKSAESADSFGIVTIGDAPALRITESVDGRECCTYIYHYNGYMMEIFSTAGSDTYPGSGEKLMAVKDLSFSLNDGLLSADITIDDSTGSRIYLNTVAAGGEHL